MNFSWAFARPVLCFNPGEGNTDTLHLVAATILENRLRAEKRYPRLKIRLSLGHLFFDYGGIVMPIGQMSMYVAFTPSMDDTIRSSLPREVCIALRSHKALFNEGELVLSVASLIPLPQAALVQPALLTLLCIH